MGGLMQLVVNGAPDVFLTGNTGDPQYSNIRDSVLYYFINSNDGYPTKDMIKSVRNDTLILDHLSEYDKPNGLIAYSINKDRAVRKIQNAWKKSISDPNYYFCKKRLINEFNQLSETIY